MSQKRKRNAIHSGIGDNDDLFVKRPKQEDVTETFKYAARLRGKKRHETLIYPEIPFEYGISYKGQLLETYNEKPYKFGINAHPEKTIAYRIEQNKTLPVKRLWEAKACFEAQVWRMNMKYALKWSGKKAVQARNTVEYAVSWKASVVSKAISDARDFFTSANGQFIGYGDSTTWKKHSSGYVYDYSNIGRFSGIIAKNYYNLTDYEAEFDFKCVLATNDQHVGGNDDDIVGLIFKAKDNKNFYMMLWERDSRVKASWRAPDHLDGFNMLTSGESAWESRVEADDCKSSSSMSSSEWSDYVNNRGWRLKHRRIYKVTNGVMKRVDTTPNSGTLGYDSSVKDLGDGKGWDLNELHSLKVNSIGNHVQIFIRDNGMWKKVFDFHTDWDEGSFGLVNVSQAVQFHRIEVREKKIIQGRIPESGWHTSNQASKTLGTGYNYCIGQAKQKANQLKASIPTVDPNSVDFIWISGGLRDPSKGSITDPIGESTTIVVTAGTHTEYESVSGRVPASGWFEFDGIGDYIHAQNAREYIKSKDSVAAQSTVTVESVVGEVWDDPQYPVPTGTVIIPSVTGQIIVHNNNPPDADKIYSKCYVRCGIVEVTPDNRNYETGLLVWADIATVFKDDYAEFFNRIDYINKKATYELLKPVKKDPPKPPAKEESEAGCVIEEPKPPEEEPIIECLNDFDFDGKKLVMWSCEFPVETTTKLFEDKVYAYRGWMTFNPLATFDPNKWTTYNLIPIEATIDPRYDEIKWAGREDYDKAPPGTKVLIRTKEWYKAIFPADIQNSGIVNSEVNQISDIPPAPEHYVHPENPEERMPDHFEVIHFLLDAWDNHPDVVMWFASNPTLTTDNADRRPESLAQEGRAGMPIVFTSNDNDKVVIHCKEDPRYLPWTSGKYIGYGKVNGKRPFFGNGSGKADMVNVSTEVVFFPENLVKETLQGPFIDIYDPEFPDYPRVKYRLHSDNKLVDFYSDYTDAYIWYTDWYSKWVEDEGTYQATMREVTQIETPLDLDPTDPNVSEDYNPDNTFIERIEVVSNNPFVKLWIEEDKGKLNGLLGTYYRFPLTANIYEEKWKVTGDYEEWVQTYEIQPYMTTIEIPIQHDNFTVLHVQVGDVVIPQDAANGWTLQGKNVILHGNAIREGMLQIKYSTGTVNNTFTLEKNLGTYIEVYVNGRLLDPVDYSISGRTLTINKNQLYLHDWVHIQSYELNEMHDPTKRNYLGEKKYSQLDFQEDQPTQPTNPNYGDPYYEGSFCFNWGYKAPEKLNLPVAPSDFKAMSMFLPEEVKFKFNVDMEIVYPVGAPVDISNFTGEWKQWNEDPIKVFDAQGKHVNGPGDWHGPPEPTYPKVTNIINQDLRSGWYNPNDVDKTDYDFEFKVQTTSNDDDMYGAIFKFDPQTQNFYSFEWDAGGWTNVKMSVFKNICQNPQDAGVAKLNYTKIKLAGNNEIWTVNANEIHKIKVSTIGNRIRVWVDDVLKFDITDNDPLEKGAWGPITQSQPQTYFWDFWMQTYRRVTYNEEPSFRQSYDLTKQRPKILGTNPMIEIELDSNNMQSKFQSILDAYCQKEHVDKASIISIEYYIRNDTSDYTVYFKESDSDTSHPTMTKIGASKLYSTVHGQYPDVGAPVEIDIPMPPEPEIPELNPPTQGNPNDGFTITWNGYIYAPESGVYKFKATVNDGFRLWIKGIEIISEWHVTGDPNYFPDYEASIYLEGGKWHPIRANYFDNVGQALIRLHWAMPGRGYQRISPDYLTPYLGYKLFAQVKQARPLPWHPMIHNGYYYHEDREHYLYAEKIVHRKTPDVFDEIWISPRPQQGSAIIVRDNEGNNLRKVTFYDEDWNLTLENKEEFHGNGYAKYYLNCKGIDKDTVKVKVNGVDLMKNDYIFHEEESAIEFMEEKQPDDLIEVRYKLLYSYYLDMNADVVDGFVNRDVAKIKLHSNYDRSKMTNMEIIYEAAKDTPFYRATEVVFNPILNHNHTGFLYITEQTEQDVKDVMVYLSDKTLSNSGLEKVLLTVRVVDKYDNPCPNKLVKIYRDGILVGEDYVTNEAGEVYLYDQPIPTDELVSVYEVHCEDIMKEALLNYYIDNQAERYYLDVVAEKLTIMAGVNDEALIRVTLRDSNWNTVGAGKTIKVEYRNTYGDKRTESFVTDEYGQVQIRVSGLHERHGNMMVKVSYDMGFEETANYIYLKVIGG
jgi:hypothetical protein